MNTEAIKRALRAVEPHSRGEFSAWDGGTLPLVAPADEAEAQAFMRAADGLVILPIGNGTKLDWCALPTRADLVFSTRRLVGLVAYEPAEGVLVARAGTDLAAIARQLRPDHQRIAPDVAHPARCTIGGAFAAAQMGADRLRRGTWRDAILGTRVLEADGQITQSGGRLVKNVTGYDLFRLHGGAHGALGIVLELSLLLWPDPPECVWLESDKMEPGSALEALAAAARAAPAASRLALFEETDGWRAVVHIEGRPRALAAARTGALRALGTARTFDGDEARAQAASARDHEAVVLPDGRMRWPLLEALGPPHASASALAALRSAAIACSIRGRLIVDGALGRCVFVADGYPEPEAVRAFARALAADTILRDHILRWRGAPPSVRRELTGPPPPGADVMARLVAAFDPAGRFARGRLHPQL